MRVRLLYCLFAAFTLMIVSSELSERKQTSGEIPVRQIVDANKPDDCVLSAINYAIKEPIGEFVTFRLTNEKLFQDNYNQKIKSITCQRCRPFALIDIRALIYYLHVPLQYTCEKEDIHYLA